MSLDSTDAVIFVLRIPKKGDYKYTVEELAEIAKQYNDLPLFRKEQPKAYDAIGERGLREELCGHVNYRAAKDSAACK